MDPFTSNELSRLRSQPQSFKPKLAVFKPYVPWTGRLSGPHSKGARSLIVITLTGDVNDILPDTTLLVGVGVNQHRIRVRSTSGSNIIVAENAIDWTDNIELESLLYFEPHPIFARIVNSDGVISYFEDFDIPYTDANEVFDPVVNMGPAAFAIEKDCTSSGTFTDLDLDASDSFVFESSVSTYQWGIIFGAADLFDAEIIGSSTSPTVTIRFWDVGDYYITCTITGANGKTRTGYRPVMVRCDSGGQTGSPFIDFIVDSLEGSKDTGYWTSSLTVFEDCNEEDFPRNVPVVIYGDVTYGSGGSRSETHVPWHYTSTAHQKFVGWIKEEAWVDEHRDKGVGITFEALGICGVLDSIFNYPAWLKSEASPSEWTDMKNLAVDRMVYYYLRHRTTALLLTDWHPTNDTRFMNYAEVPESSIFTGLRDFLAGTIFADMSSDRNSAIWTEVDAQMLSDAARDVAIVTAHALTSADRMDELLIPTTRDRPETSWLSIDGLYFDGVTNTPRIGYAPGYVISSAGGTSETISGLVLNQSQAAINQDAGRLFSLRNNPYKDVTFTSQGVYPYDIAPQSIVNYSAPSGTFRAEQIEDADLLIRSINDQFLPESLGLVSELNTEMVIRDQDAVVHPSIPKAVNGVEGLFPTDITGLDPDQFGIDWPDGSFDWPAFDDTAASDTSGLGTSIGGDVDTVIAMDDDKLMRTTNFRDATPTWTQIFFRQTNHKLAWFALDAFDPTQQTMHIVEAHISNFSISIWESTNILDAVPTWTLLRSFTANGGAHGRGTYFSSINIEDYFALVRPRSGTVMEVWHTHDRWQTFTNVQESGLRMERAVGADLTSRATGPTTGHLYMGLWETPVADRAKVYISSDMGHTFTKSPRVLVSTEFPPRLLLIPYTDNESDNIFFVSGGTGQNNDCYIKKSTDGGASFGPDLAPTKGGHKWGAGDAGVASAIRNRQLHVFTFDTDIISGAFHEDGGVLGSVFFYSTDGGVTWDERFTFPGIDTWNIGGNPFDENWFLASGVSDLMASSDGGVTFVTKGWAGYTNGLWAVPIFV